MSLNYERLEPPAAMIAECDEITLKNIRTNAETLDRIYVEAYGPELGNERLDKLSAECDERILDTLRAFSDQYEGQSVCLLLSGLLHLALTTVYTVEYQVKQMELQHEADEIMGGE